MSIKIIMQPTCFTVQNMLGCIDAADDVEIEQIVCLEQRKAYGEVNVDIFHEVLSLCFTYPKYQAYYYYDNINSHINDMMIMPNVIIFEECAMMFDYKVEKGIYVTDKGTLQYINDKYEEIKANAHSFVKNQDPFTLRSSEEAMLNAKQIISINGDICIGCCVGKDIFSEYLLPFEGKDEYIETMSKVNGWWDGYFYNNELVEKGIINTLCKKDGIHEFMNTGRVCEFPYELYRPLDMKTRKLCLERIIKLIDLGYINYMIADDDVCIPSGFTITSTIAKTNEMSVHRNNGSEISLVKTNEYSVANSVVHYIEYLRKKGKISEGKDAQDIIRSILNMYE